MARRKTMSEMIPRIRKALIRLLPTEHLAPALRAGGVRTHGVNRETLDNLAFRHWALVENACFEWIQCALEENDQ
jgi:hypothetical protein